MAHAQSPKEIVLEFYKLALEKFDPKTAFETYATPDFVEHSADIAGGTRQAAIAFLQVSSRGFPRRSGESFALQQKVISFFSTLT